MRYPHDPLQNHQSPKLLDLVRRAIRTKHYSLRTEEAYVRWIRRFILFHDKRHPRDMGAAEVQQFLSDLAVTHHVAAATQNQALSAVLFLYQHVLKQEIAWVDDIVRAETPMRVPVVLTPGEVADVLRALSGVPWMMANLLYGSGLRLMECVRLRVKDIDFSYHQITVREGKGMKDRVTMLPRTVRADLQRHLHSVKQLHDQDLEEGFGEVYLPFALEKKYPSANREWAWSYGDTFFRFRSLPKTFAGGSENLFRCSVSRFDMFLGALFNIRIGITQLLSNSSVVSSLTTGLVLYLSL